MVCECDQQMAVVFELGSVRRKAMPSSCFHRRLGSGRKLVTVNVMCEYDKGFAVVFDPCSVRRRAMPSFL